MNRTGIVCAALLFGIFVESPQAATPEKKPNIIFIMADDVSAKEYSIYGGEGIDTPNLNRMAREGVAFKTAWATPQCAPTRAVLHTGNYACNTDWFGNEVHGSDFSSRPDIMGKVMQRQGYKTLWHEKFHFSGDPSRFGFDEYAVDWPWDGYTGSPQDRGGEMYQIQWYWHPGIVHNGKGVPTGPDDFGPDIHAGLIADFIQRKHEKPFFVYWAAFLPHKDFNNKTWLYTDVPELDADGNKTGRRVPGSLKADLEYLDHLLGKIMGAVELAGLDRETIVVFTGDNGTSPYGKCRFEDERGPRVPFVVWGPGRVKARPMSDVLIDFTDILPTLAELGGGTLPTDGRLDGHGFAPYLTGQPFKERETIFCQFYDGQWVRDQRYLRDARGDYYDCGTNRDETKGYRKMTMQSDPETLPQVRQRFKAVLDRYPVPDTKAAPQRRQWENYFKHTGPALLPENLETNE